MIKRGYDTVASLTAQDFKFTPRSLAQNRGPLSNNYFAITYNVTLPIKNISIIESVKNLY